MPIASKVNKLWQRIAGTSKQNSLDRVAERFLQVFQEHGVEVAQIPRLLPQVRLDDLKTRESLLAVLTPELLDKTAQLFGVRIPWLEGVDDQIYEYRSCYKQPDRFFEDFASLHISEDDYPLRVLAMNNQLDRNNPSDQLLIPILLEKIAELGEEEIYRYHVYCDGWDWSNYPARIQLKAMVRTLYRTLRKPIPLYATNPTDFEKILDKKQIPKRHLDRCLLTSPSLEDYVFVAAESITAKEVEELPEVLEYIEDHHLESMIAKKLAVEPENEAAAVDTVKSNAAKAANAKHAPKNAIKRRFITFYQTEGGDYPSKTDSAKRFFDTLDEKNKLKFLSKKAAVRTLLEALREHLKESTPSE